jgi:hypothetical protein
MQFYLMESAIEDCKRLLINASNALGDVDGGYLGFIDKATGDNLLHLKGESAMWTMATATKNIASTLSDVSHRLREEGNIYEAAALRYKQAETGTGNGFGAIIIGALWDMIDALGSAVGQNDTGSVSGGSPYTHNNGITYNVVPNLNPDYYYNQNNYSIINDHSAVSGGTNIACPATAEAIAYSIYHNERVTPNDYDSWNSNGATWANSNPVGFDGMNQLRIAYDNITQGRPVLLRVETEKGKDGHSVVAVGIIPGADPNNLTASDILIIDPWGGKLICLADRNTPFIDTPSMVRVPK